MTFDIAIISHNTDFYLLNLLSSVREALSPNSFGSCHVWDNGSTDASLAVLEELARDMPWLEVHTESTNLGHGPALDRLLRDHCREEWVLLLDSDTRLLRDFRAALPDLTHETPAFIGQIHSQARRPYAYLCHLLVNRGRYLRLPPFTGGGAPGVDFFRAVHQLGVHWRRFRWVDYVEHYGQGTLHRLLELGETDHELYAFAWEESRRNPVWSKAVARERELKQRLAEFLAQKGTTASTRPADLAPVETPASSRHVSALAAARHALIQRALPRVPLPSRFLPLVAAKVGTAQNRHELELLFGRVRQMRPWTVVEVGSTYGGTLFLWARAARPDATLVSVGLPPWELDDPGEEGRRRALATLARRKQRLRVIRADPLHGETRGKVDSFLGGRPVDFLFFATQGSAEQLRERFERYAPLVRAGGLIAVDEIRSRLGADHTLSESWRDIRSRFGGEELVDREDQNGFGIGLIRVGDWNRGGR